MFHRRTNDRFHVNDGYVFDAKFERVVVNVKDIVSLLNTLDTSLSQAKSLAQGYYEELGVAKDQLQAAEYVIQDLQERLRK